MQDHEMLVVGGTGKTGWRIGKRLKARGLTSHIGSRSSTPPFDWEDIATWAGVLGRPPGDVVSYTRETAASGIWGSSVDKAAD